MILIKYIETYNLNAYSLMALGKQPEDKSQTFVKAETNDASEKGPVSQLNLSDKEEVVVVAVNPVKNQETIIIKEAPPAAKKETTASAVVQRTSIYPFGEFKINETRVVYAESGTSLLSLATSYNIPLKYLYDFNDFTTEKDLLDKPQLIYLQRKRKTGADDHHIVAEGETLYDIAQKQGIRLDALLQLNYLNNTQKPALGQKLYLKNSAPSIPEIASANIPSKSEENNLTINEDEGDYEVHVVQAKETLYGLSKKYNVSMQQLMQWNNLTATDLKQGMELIVSQKDYDAYKGAQ
jgi:LysM repeat protein